jgi:hypothetical protein
MKFRFGFRRCACPVPAKAPAAPQAPLSNYELVQRADMLRERREVDYR